MEEKLEPKLRWLKVRLKWDDKGLNKLIHKNPPVLGMTSVEANLEVRVFWLQKRLLLDDKSLSLVIRQMPRLLLGLNSEKILSQH